MLNIYMPRLFQVTQKPLETLLYKIEAIDNNSYDFRLQPEGYKVCSPTHGIDLLDFKMLTYSTRS